MRFWKSFWKVFVVALTFAFFALSVTPVVAMADAGPKRSVRITVQGIDDRQCIATLLSERESTGPWSVCDGSVEDYENYSVGVPDYETYLKFVAYDEQDEYYFLGNCFSVTDGEEFAWGYYPPKQFKLLLYFPQNNAFVVSQPAEEYAFHSYYKVTLLEGELPQGVSAVPCVIQMSSKLSTSYGYGKEAIGLTARILITVAVELAVSLLFGFRKKQWLLLVGVNVGTQLFLNLMLNVFGVRWGGIASIPYVLCYLLLELAVVAIETLLYRLFMDRLAERKRTLRHYIGYSFAANGASFGVGLLLSVLIPSIF